MRDSDLCLDHDVDRLAYRPRSSGRWGFIGWCLVVVAVSAALVWGMA